MRPGGRRWNVAQDPSSGAATAALEGRVNGSEVAGTLTLESTAFLSLPWLGEPSLSQHRSGVIQNHHGLDRIVPTCVDQARCRVLSASLGRPHCFASGGVLRPGSVAGLCIRVVSFGRFCEASVFINCVL